MELLISMPGGFEWVIIVCVLLIPVMALVEIIRSQFANPENKIIWVLVVLLMPFIGAFLYWIFGRQQKIR
jgi:hypothetical protein